MTRSDRTNASFVNQARRVALRGAKTARAEDQIRHLMFSVVTPERVNLVSSRRAREAGTAARSRVSTRTAKPEVHVRNTSRVTSPTPFGVQKQNWRVRRLVSSRRGPPFFASGGHPPIEKVGALGVAGWVYDGRRSASYLISRRVFATRSESRDTSGRSPSHDRAVAPQELPPPAKSAQVFTLQNLITRLAASTATLFTVACPPRPLPLACVRCLAEVEVIRSLLGSVFHVHHRVSRLGAPCARCAPGASMPLDRACVLILGLG